MRVVDSDLRLVGFEMRGLPIDHEAAHGSTVLLAIRRDHSSWEVEWAGCAVREGTNGTPRPEGHDSPAVPSCAGRRSHRAEEGTGRTHCRSPTDEV